MSQKHKTVQNKANKISIFLEKFLNPKILPKYVFVQNKATKIPIIFRKILILEENPKIPPKYVFWLLPKI